MIKRRKNPTSYFLSVDIQPEYERLFSFDTQTYTDYLNYLSTPIIFLYNGHDTLGMIKEKEYQNWLLENGLSRKTLQKSKFYDKGYAYFRYCMDNNISDDLIISFVKFLYKNKINDSRDLTSENWNKFFKTHGKKGRNERQIRSLLEFSGDLVYVPDLMDYLKKYDNYLVTGGGIDECLKEVEIALQALNKEYSILQEFTF